MREAVVLTLVGDNASLGRLLEYIANNRKAHCLDSHGTDPHNRLAYGLRFKSKPWLERMEIFDM